MRHITKAELRRKFGLAWGVDAARLNRQGSAAYLPPVPVVARRAWAATLKEFA